MQAVPVFASPNELHKLAQRFQRIANALTRLAETARDYPMLLKLGTLDGAHLRRIEQSLNRVCAAGARQVVEVNDEIGRSLLA